MFPRHCGRQHIEFVHPDHVIDRSRAGYIRRGSNVIHHTGVVRHCPDVIDRRPDPRLIEQLFSSYERDVPSTILGFLEKLISFKFAGKDDDVFLHKMRHAHIAFIVDYKFCFARKEWHNLAVNSTFCVECA